MGTSITILLPLDQMDAALGVEALFRVWHRALTRFEPTSDLSRLNRARGESRVVSDLLFEVLLVGRLAAEATDGLFDPTLLRSLEAIGYDRDFESLRHGADRITNARTSLERVRRSGGPRSSAPPTGGWRDIELDPSQRRVRLPVGVGIDLGGLAKGMAVDAAVASLAARGIRSAIVDAGGDLAVIGLPPGASAWPIAVELPGGYETISVRAGALATSSVARRRWRQGDLERHHLVDPRTGLPSTQPLWSVSVAAVTCAQAEVAAKAAFLLGAEAGARFLGERGLSGLFVLPHGRTVAVGEWSAA